MERGLTFTLNKEVNEKVLEIIEEIEKELIRLNPKSIILTGSFGKGEAVVFEENGKLKFLSDCEVLLIPYKWIFSRKKLNYIEEKFYQEYGLKLEIWGFTETIYFYFPSLIKPSIRLYELKYGSKVIYGKNYLEKIPEIKPSDIPIWEGIKLLLNRMCESMKFYGKWDEKCVFWVDKIIIACQDALLLTTGKYSPSYTERNSIFSKLKNSFDLNCIDKLVKFTKRATERKVKFKNDFPDPKDYWFEVATICDKVFKYVIKKGFKLDFEDYFEFHKEYMTSSLCSYTSLPFQNILMQNIFRFLKNKISGHKIPTLSMVFRMKKWDHLLYSAIPLLYFGIDADMKVNKFYLEKCINILENFGLKVKDKENWEEVRDKFLMC
ncbi:MAG: hypothetical protein N3A69_15005, partial [Leptospiraceae bacterium]|nr:hypothetical protein [Leptospiraceae bacterium]